MILIFCAAIFVIRLLYLLAEVCFERDWPRHTWRGLALSLILLVLCVSIFA
jgi:hypothetical protein